MESSKVFIVILNKDGKDCLSECLRAVFSLSYEDFEVVVVDNASRDGSIEEARRNFSRAHFILHKENLGFAAGMNTGIRYARSKGAKYVWLLNNDATPGRGALTELVQVARRERDMLLSPLILDTSGKHWFAGGHIDWRHMRTTHVAPLPGARSNEPYETGYLSGCALFLPMSVIDTVGLFDEGYFLYYEDADYSFRAKAEGYRLFVVPQSVVVHSERSRENPEKTYWLVRSGIRFFRTHTAWWRRPYIACYFALRKLKNRFNRKQGSQEAELVASAYRDEQKDAKMLKGK